MKKPSPTRLMLATNDCQVFDRHQWHATFEVGKYLCTSCGASYFCPACTTSIPRRARVRFCPRHRTEHEGQAPAKEVQP